MAALPNANRSVTGRAPGQGATYRRVGCNRYVYPPAAAEFSSGFLTPDLARVRSHGGSASCRELGRGAALYRSGVQRLVPLCA